MRIIVRPTSSRHAELHSASLRFNALLLGAVFATLVCAQPRPSPTPIDYKSPVQDKNFYLLSLMERTPGVREAIVADAALKKIGTSRVAALSESIKKCQAQIDCYGTALKWNDADAEEARAALVKLYTAA